MPRNKLQPCFTSLTETSLHEPLTDHKIVRAALGTVTVRSTVGSTVRTLEVLTESPDTFFGAYHTLYTRLHEHNYIHTMYGKTYISFLRVSLASTY